MAEFDLATLMASMMGDMAVGSGRIRSIKKELSTRGLPDGVSFRSDRGAGLMQTAFQVSFDGTKRGLSIAAPSDMIRSGCGYVETALIDTTTDELMYDGDLGYSDVRRFDSVDELYDELIRLRDKLRSDADST